MEIKIAITNLGKYNEGELAFEWMTLPADEDELQDALQAIGIDGKRYEEYFISDYEAPFPIGEYESIAKLNEVAEKLEEVDMPEKHYGMYDVADVINFAHQAEEAGFIQDAFEFVGDLIDDDQLDELVEREAQESGWQRVKCLLGCITDLNGEYYRINGYGNVENISDDFIECIVSDIIDEIY